MSNVTLFIGGRKFTVSCADGEEAHVGALGALIHKKVETLGETAGQNEVRMLLYAALVLADELNEARAAASAQQNAAMQAPAVPADLAERLERIAGRIENIAECLEPSLDNA